MDKPAARLKALVNQTKNPGTDANELLSDAEDEREASIAALVKRYTCNLRAHKIALPTIPAGKDVAVILTGSTGSLGSYLLHELCRNPRVSKIYCFNRRPNAKFLAEKDFEVHSIALDSLDKVEFLCVDLGHDTFGLETAKGREIIDSVDIIMHNAWAVHFHHMLQRFEKPHIKGLRTFIDWSIQSHRHPQIFFISTIGTVAVSARQPVPEILFKRPSAVPRMGYAEGKFVAERILDAASRTGIPVTILRLGQAAGPTTVSGQWNEKEWLPIMFKSSVALGAVPSSLGGFSDRVNWVPVDVCAIVCLELALQARYNQHAQNLNVYHLSNPQTSSWQELVPVVQEYYAARNVPMKICSFAEWMDRLHQAVAMGVDTPPYTKVPAMKLLEYFEGMKSGRGMPSLATTVTCQASETLARLEAIQPAMLRHYLRQLDY